MKPVVCEVTTTVKASPEDTFVRVVPIDLPSIFRGFGPLPAVVATEEQTGAWDTAGQTRRVRLSDGSTAREMLTDYDPPRYFGYRVSDFSGPLRFLTTGARGEWWFEDEPGRSTALRWRYAFEPRSALARPVLWAIVRPLWRGYMASALRGTQILVESSAPAPTS